MNENAGADEVTPVRPQPRRWWRRHLVLAGLALLVICLLAGGAVLGLTGRTVPMPVWMVERVSARVNVALAGQASTRIGGIELLVDEGFAPHVNFRDTELFSPKGRRIATVPDLRVTLRGRPILSGQLIPRTLSMTGARIALRRLADGNFDVALGEGAALAGGAQEPAEILNAIDRAFELPALKSIKEIEIADLNLSLDDARSRQTWLARDGWLRLHQDPRRVAIDLGLSLDRSGGNAQGRAELHFTTVKASPEASLLAKVTDVRARDLAAQAPALAWLGALDAPISGTLRSGLDAKGRVQALQATLDIGAGALQPTPDAKPVRFDKARVDLGFDPAADVLDFREIAVEGPALQAHASGRAWLKGAEAGGLPDSLVAQIAFDQLSADPEGLFQDPVTFGRGLLDFRLNLAPFRVDLGQFVLLDGDRRIEVRGHASADAGGWSLAFDSDINAITSRRLLALWPLAAVPKTRAWLVENLATSELFDVRAALRVLPGQEPHLSLGYEYRDTEVRVIRSLPPVEDGAGYAVIADNSYTLVVDRGHVTAPAGGRIDVAGTILSIPDLRERFAPARVTLRTKSSIHSALSLLDEPPFQFMTKAGLPVDLAEGQAEVVTTLDLRLVEKLRPEDVDYLVIARLSDVATDRIAPGRMLTAGALSLIATRSGIEISGPATLSGVPLDFTWRQRFGPDHKGQSTVDGSIELSQRFYDAFGIGLDADLVQGAGRGDFTLTLVKGAAPGFRLTSDLAGLGMRLPGIDWSKPPKARGKLDVKGRLGAPATIDGIEMSAAGLTIGGDIRLTGDGQFDRAVFSRASLDDWFSGALQLVGRGKGRAPAIQVTGGTLDLRRAKFRAVADNSRDPAPITLALDRVKLSEKIVVAGFRGEFSTIGGLSGTFKGDLNGATPLRGTVVPMDGQAAFRIRSDDAGAAMRAAGIFRRGLGGALDLTFRPDGGAGSYRGRARITDIRVTDTPVLAELLDAVSVVGLLNQLNGPGLQFTTVEGEFRLTPDAVEISQGSAVGPSLGISGAGVYHSDRDVIDLQGTISPIYLLNGIGQIFTRRGEGLFGFNYRLAGPAADPTVKVNPLSILTPGMFRDIFRSDPPKLPQ
ncbi:MAG: hypothetical protein KDE03_03245 [Rhodobacteraceae bacterium]|nr:hypothetical protein [Paracoccaceae bacterium]